MTARMFAHYITILLFAACTPAGNISQGVTVESPDQSRNSNNTNTQNNVNAGTGSQSNTHTGSGTQNNSSVTVGGNQSNSENNTVTTVGGNQNNTTTNVSGNQTTNTVNGNQTNTTVNGDQNNTTVTGNQTVINGDQNNTTHNTTNNVTNNTTINNITIIRQEVIVGDYIKQGTEFDVKWEAQPKAEKYVIFLNNQIFAETNTPSIQLPNNEQIKNATIGIIAAPASTPNSSLPVPPAINISDIIGTYFSGIIYEDTGVPLQGVKVTAKSLNSAIPFEAQVTTSADGRYSFNSAPTGVQIEIVAYKAGYTTRHQIGVMQANVQKSQSINQFNFSGESNSLSDKPEVISMTPSRNGSGFDPGTMFVLKFSEPMDTDSVKDNFIIYSANDKKLTVDTSSSTLTVSGGTASNFGTPIWDRQAFVMTWNSDDTEATFTFKDERRLPTDKIAAKVPDYLVALNRDNGVIKDKTGLGRGANENKFKLTGGVAENYCRFSIRTDETPPSISFMTASTAETGGLRGDSIRIRFSEPMIYHFPFGSAIPGGSPAIAGGMGGNLSQAALAFHTLPWGGVADNYKITVLRTGTPILENAGWGNLGGTIILDADDPTNKSVLLVPPTSNADVFKPGDSVTVAVAATVVDPAGNPMAGNTMTKTAQ
jgi:hypothetical protein